MTTPPPWLSFVQPPLCSLVPLMLLWYSRFWKFPSCFQFSFCGLSLLMTAWRNWARLFLLLKSKILHYLDKRDFEAMLFGNTGKVFHVVLLCWDGMGIQCIYTEYTWIRLWVAIAVKKIHWLTSFLNRPLLHSWGFILRKNFLQKRSRSDPMILRYSASVCLM